MRIAIAKGAFYRNISHLTSKLNIEMKKKLVMVLWLKHSFIWFRDLEALKIGKEVFGKLLNVIVDENGEDKMVGESN